MADIYYMSGNIKDNINGKLFIIRNDLEFSKIVKPSDNNLCIFKSDKESFFCHILKDKTTDQFDIPLAITDTTEQDVKEDVIGETPSIAISSDNTSTNNTPLPQSIQDILIRYKEVLIGQYNKQL